MSRDAVEKWNERNRTVAEGLIMWRVRGKIGQAPWGGDAVPGTGGSGEGVVLEKGKTNTVGDWKKQNRPLGEGMGSRRENLSPGSQKKCTGRRLKKKGKRGPKKRKTSPL